MQTAGAGGEDAPARHDSQLSPRKRLTGRHDASESWASRSAGVRFQDETGVSRGVSPLLLEGNNVKCVSEPLNTFPQESNKGATAHRPSEPASQYYRRSNRRWRR